MKIREKRIWTEADFKLNEQTTTLTANLHGLSCPACQSRNYIKCGKEKGNQRYQCSTCQKHFRSTTGNTIHHLHLKPKIHEYINCMNQGLSLRKTAAKCEMSLQTAFRWRHRFLKAMENHTEVTHLENKVLSAYVLPFSNKGKSVSPSKTKPKITSILQIGASGQTTIHVLGKYGDTVCKLSEKTKGRTTYITSKAIPKLFKQEPPRCVTAEQKLQTHQVHTQINKWLAKFRGVATKYLKNYWNWFSLIRKLTLKNSNQSQYMYNCF